MKALVYGGAFNPPTRAHIELADFARTQAGFDKVIFVPSKMSYISEDQKKDSAFDDSERLAMLKRIAETHPWMEVCEYELNARVQPRTYITMRWLREQGYDCSLLIGSDKLTELEAGWQYVDEICHEFGIYVMVRNNTPCDELLKNEPYLKSIAPYVTVIHTPDTWQDMSSTKVRTLYRQTEELIRQMNEMIPEEISGWFFVKGEADL